MATCKKNCIHYPVCGIWDRKVFVDYEKDILSDFSDLPNVEEHCRNYLPNRTQAEWVPQSQYVKLWGMEVIQHYKCSNCGNIEYTNSKNYCSNCGAEMRKGGEE